MQKDIDAGLSAIQTLRTLEEMLYKQRNAVADTFIPVVRKIQQLQYDHHDICEEFGYESDEAHDSFKAHNELNEKYVNDYNLATQYCKSRLVHIIECQRALQNTYRQKLGDMAYMTTRISSDYEISEYFVKHGIQRSTETDYNKNMFIITYTLMHTSTIEEYNYFIEQMLQYFGPNTWDGEGYRFKIGYTRTLYLEFRNEWWHIMDDDVVLFEDPMLIEALKYMEMVR